MILTRQQKLFRGNGSAPAVLSARETADAAISALSPAAWYRNGTNVVSSGGFASLWGDYAGTTLGLVLPGASGNYASVPDAGYLDLTDDLYIAVRVAAREYTPAVNNTLIGKWGPGTESWRLYINATTGVLVLILQGMGSYSSTAAPTCTDGTPYWILATRVRSTGKINFYQAADSATLPSSWTQVGTEVSGWTSALLSTSATLNVGASGAGEVLNGTIYRAIVKDGIDGTTVFDADFSAQSFGASSFTESSSNAATVTVNTSGAAPAHIGYARDLMQGTGTNQPAYAAGVLTFDGADNYMVASSWSLAQPTSIYYVLNQVSWTGSDHISDGTAANSGWVYQTGLTPNVSLYAGGSPAAANTDITVGAYKIVCVVFNGASSSIRANNNAKTTGNPGATGMGGLTLASRASVTAYGNIAVKELVIFGAAHNDATQSSVITALNNALTVF